MRLAKAAIITKFLESFTNVVYKYANGQQSTVMEDCQGWRLTWRSEPSPRIQVRTDAPELLQLAKVTLLALGYEVRDKDNHLVVIM